MLIINLAVLFHNRKEACDTHDFIHFGLNIGCYQLNVWIDFDADEQRWRSFYNQIIKVPAPIFCCCCFLPKNLCNKLNQLNQHEIYCNFVLVFRSRIIFEVNQVHVLNNKRKTLKTIGRNINSSSSSSSFDGQKLAISINKYINNWFCKGILNLLRYLNERVEFDFLAFCKTFNCSIMFMLFAQNVWQFQIDLYFITFTYFFLDNIFDNSVAEHHLSSSISFRDSSLSLIIQWQRNRSGLVIVTVICISWCYTILQNQTIFYAIQSRLHRLWIIYCI